MRNYDGGQQHMDAMQANTLVTRAALIDPRLRPDVDRAELWAQLLPDVTFQEAMAAMVEHYRDSDRMLMPAHVLEHTRLARAKAERMAQRELQRNREPEPVHAPLTPERRKLLAQIEADAREAARRDRALLT